MACPYCKMPVDVRPLEMGSSIFAYSVTCKYCDKASVLSFRTRVVSVCIQLAGVGMTAALLIAFVNAYTPLIEAHQSLFNALLVATGGILLFAGYALSIVYCSRYGALVEPGIL